MRSTDTTTRGGVVVGVTGPGRETAALKFAAEWAARERAEVVLVHAYGAALPPPPPSVLMTYRRPPTSPTGSSRGSRRSSRN